MSDANGRRRSNDPGPSLTRDMRVINRPREGGLARLHPANENAMEIMGFREGALSVAPPPFASSPGEEARMPSLGGHEDHRHACQQRPPPPKKGIPSFRQYRALLLRLFT